MFKFEYSSEQEREDILEKNKDKYLIEEHNIAQGNFLIFTDIKPSEVALAELYQKIKTAELQITALDDKSELLEGALVELTSMVLE